MNNVNTLIHNLTTPATVMAKLRDLLCVVDPEYEKEAKAFDDACATLIAGVKDITSITPETYLSALEEEMASDILFVVGQGFKLCYDIHTNPVNALAFQMDYEDLHQERKMYLMPMARKALNTSHAFLEELRASNRDIGIDFVRLDTIDYLKEHLFGHFLINYHNAQVHDAFHKSLPEAFQGLEDDIRDYFIHLECAGPKLAHYAGYIIGNHSLKCITHYFFQHSVAPPLPCQSQFCLTQTNNPIHP